MYMHECLHGLDGGDVAHLSPALQARFKTLPEFMTSVQKQRPDIETFNIYKANIEAYEYPLFSHLMRDPDVLLRDTWQIAIEMHRMGMSGGAKWSSLMYAELLYATFMSGGFHPISTEKWHDSNAAQDVLFVNATWFIESEVYMTRTAWRNAERSQFLKSAQANTAVEYQPNVQPQNSESPAKDHTNTISLKNRLKETVSIYWINPNTHEKVYNAECKPGETSAISTFIGHTFEISGPTYNQILTVTKNEQIDLVHSNDEL